MHPLAEPALSTAALAPIRFAVAALPSRPITHDLAIPGDLGQPCGLLDGPELLGVTPMLL